MVKPLDLHIGQHWYFFQYSTTFVIYDIKCFRKQYTDGDVIKEKYLIYLKGTNNSTIERIPEEFDETTCKIIQDTKVSLPHKLEITNVNIPTRLESIDE